MNATMKRLSIITVILTASGVGQALAQGICTATLTATELSSLIPANTCICGAPGATRPNLSWNETHLGATMNELGLDTSGTGSPVGTYSIGGNDVMGQGDHGVITYNYTSGPTFQWVVDIEASGTTYTFCAAGSHTPVFTVNIKPGACTPNC